MAIKLLSSTKRQSQPSNSYNVFDTFVNGVKRAGSVLSQKASYFNPTSNNGNNFWSNPVVQKISQSKPIKVATDLGTPVAKSLTEGAKSYTRFRLQESPNFQTFAPQPLKQKLGIVPRDQYKQSGQRSKDVFSSLRGGLTALGMTAAPASVVGGAILNPVFEGGVQLVEQAIQKKPLKVKVDVAKSMGEGAEFGAILGPIDKLAGYVLRPLLKRINPVEVGNIEKYLKLAIEKGGNFLENPYIKLATKRILQNVGAESIKGGVGMGAYGGLEPADSLEERVKNILANALQGFVLSGAMKTLGYAGQAGKTIIKGPPKTENIPLGLKTRVISREEHYRNLAEQQKGQAILGGGKTVETVKVGNLNIEKPVSRAVSVTFNEGSKSSGFHRNLDKVSNIGPSWAIVYKKTPSKVLLDAAEKAGLKVNIRPTGITDIYIPNVLRGEPQKAQKIFDKFAEIYQSTKMEQTPEQARIAFQKYWSEKYGNRPKTERTLTQLAKTNFEKHGIVPEGMTPQEVNQKINAPKVDVNQLRKENITLLNQKAPGENMSEFFNRNPEIAQKYNENKVKITNSGEEIPLKKQRGLYKQILKDENTDQFVKDAVSALPQEYLTVANKPVWEEALRMVKENPDMARERLLNKNEAPSPERSALWIALAKKYFNEGNIEMGQDIARMGAEEATLLGQATQAWRMWSLFTPEGMVREVQKNIRKSWDKETQAGKLVDRIGQGILHRIGIRTKATGDVTEEISKAVSNEFNIINREASESVSKELQQLNLGFLKETFDPNRYLSLGKTSIDKAMRQELKTAGVDIAKIVKDHYSRSERVKIDLQEKIAKRLGIPTEKAKPITDYIAKRFDELTREKKQKFLEKAFAEKKVKTDERITTEGKDSLLDKIIKLSNTGAFSEEKYLEPLAKKLGLPVMTPEIQRDIYERMQKLQVEKDPRKKLQMITDVFDVINNLTPPGFWETIDVMRYNGMLSGLKPQERNVFGNMFNLAVLRPAVLTTQVFNDWVGATLRGEERKTYFKQVPAYYRGFINSIPEAMRAWSDGWKGIARNENPDLRSLRLRQFDKRLTFASGLLEAFDRFFTVLGTQGELASLRAGGKLTEEQALSRAQQTAEQFIYRNKLDPKNKTGQGHFLSSFDKTTEAVQALARDVPLIKWVVPFIRISAMVAKEASQYTPLIGNIAKVGSEGWQREQIAAKNMLGYGVMMAGFALALDGRTTFAAPKDEKKRKLFYSTGRLPYAIKIGNSWVPYINSPLIFAIGIPAAMQYYNTEDPEVDTKEGIERWTSVLGKAITGQLSLFTGQTFLQNFDTLFSVLKGDENVNMGTFMAQTAGTVNPYQGLLRTIAQLVDPVYRKAKTPVEVLFKDLPGLSTLVPSYEDALGQPSKRNPINAFLPYDIGTAKPEFELPYQMRTGELKQSAVEKKRKQEITTFVDQMKNMSQEDLARTLVKMRQENPQDYIEVRKQMLEKRKDQYRGGGTIQGAYKTQPGQEPGRAKYILDQVSQMDPVKSQEFLTQMRSMGVITPKVLSEMRKQISTSGKGFDYNQTMMQKIRNLLSVSDVSAAEMPPELATQQTPAVGEVQKETNIPKVKFIETTKKKVNKRLLTAAGKTPRKVKVRKTRKLKLKTPKQTAIKVPRITSSRPPSSVPRIKLLKFKFPKLPYQKLKAR